MLPQSKAFFIPFSFELRMITRAIFSIFLWGTLGLFTIHTCVRRVPSSIKSCAHLRDFTPWRWRLFSPFSTNPAGDPIPGTNVMSHKSPSLTELDENKVAFYKSITRNVKTHLAIQAIACFTILHNQRRQHGVRGRCRGSRYLG